MSYSWKSVPGQDYSNRARYNICYFMRKNNIAASSNVIPGVSAKKIYLFLSGKQDITISKLGLIANYLGMDICNLFYPIPEKPEELKMPYSYKAEIAHGK